MVLWITALYNQGEGPRWIPCYLDLKKARGQEMIRLLGGQRQYRIMLFPLEEAQQCSQVLISTISPFQGPLLTDWADSSKLHPPVEEPALSRQLLKEEFEKLKPKLLMRLEARLTNNSVLGKDLAG
jgi:serine/threonine-protein kinase